MGENEEVSTNIKRGLSYIKNHTEIDNVLVSGGDPMILSTEAIEKILKALHGMNHIKIIRLGSKMPAFNPYRFINDPDLIDILGKYSKANRKIYFVCHFDHPKELTRASREAVRLIQSAGLILLNQSPIIRGISDNSAILSELWNELTYMGVQQYYVFQNRPTRGNKPFTVPLVEAYRIIENAKRFCSGLAKRIRYVMSHESGKVEIMGVDNRYIYLKYHRARYVADEQRFFVCNRDDKAYWLDQLKPADGHKNRYYRKDLVLPANIN